MKKFIFISPEGATFSPNESEVENMQVIGIVEKAIDENDALKKLLIENEWIIDSEFNIAEFIVMKFYNPVRDLILVEKRY